MATAQPSDKLDIKRFDVEKYQYPIDLNSANDFQKYGGNHVMFFINVQSGSKLVKDKKVAVLDNVPTSRFKEFEGEAAKDAIAGGISKVWNKTKQLGSKVGIDSSDDNIVDSALKVIGPKKRLAAAINLYVPESVVKGYQVSWGGADSEDMMTGDRISQLIKAGSDGGLAGVMTAGIGLAGSSMAKSFIGGNKYLQKSLGITPGNSKAELLFQQVEFGGINFDYKFSPKSEKEAENVLNIIRMFRHHMLPEFLDKAGYLYIYPSEFEIRYYRGTDENEHLEKHFNAVLTSMNINYSPNGSFTTFANGMPTQINLTLTFRELNVPTKETSPYDRSGA